MSPPDRLALLELYGELYGRLRLAVAFTESIVGDAAKRCRVNWSKPKPLPDGPFGAGLLKNRGVRRNPVVVLRPSGLVGVECDTLEGLEQLEALALPTTVTVQSSEPHKLHLWFRPPAGAPEFVAFRFEQRGVTADRGRYLLAPAALHPSGHIYCFLPSPEDGIATLPQGAYDELVRLSSRAGEGRRRLDADLDTTIPEGARNDTLTRIAGAMRRRGMAEASILVALLEENARRCRPPLGEDEVRDIAASIARYQPAANLTYAGAVPLPGEKSEESEKSPPYCAYLAFFAPRTRGKPRAWRLPRCTGPPAAGRESTAPYSEACTVGALVAELVAFGNAVGRCAWTQVGATPHYLNENALFMGPTATARKGEAMRLGIRPVRLAEGRWGERIARGFGSGEAIVWEVRDPPHGIDEDGNEKLIDEGAEDKRLLIHEDELAHVLAVAAREGSTLSSLIRSAWDGTRLENRTKGHKPLATEAHVACWPPSRRRRCAAAYPRPRSPTASSTGSCSSPSHATTCSPSRHRSPATWRPSTWKTCGSPWRSACYGEGPAPCVASRRPASVGRRRTGRSFPSNATGSWAPPARGQRRTPCVCR